MQNALELEVVRLYELLDAELVEHDCLLDNRQIDVFVQMVLPDQTPIRIAIECKDYSNNVPVEEVSKFASLAALLQSQGLIDKGIIVASKGFTKAARKHGASHGIGCITLETLKRSFMNFFPYVQRLKEFCEKNYVSSHQCYIRQKALTETGGDVQSMEDYIDQWLEGEDVQLTVLGDYGTGKTTLSQHIAQRQAIRHMEKPTQERIPILIQLRDYMKEFRIESLLRDVLVDQYQVRLPSYTMVGRLNERGCFLLILDGFDEMACQVDESIMLRNFNEIMSIITPKSKVILTCRTHYFKTSSQMHRVHEGSELYEQMHRKWGSRFLFLQPFSQEDISAYLKMRLGPCVGSAAIGQRVLWASRVDRWLTYSIVGSCMAFVKSWI